MEIFKDHKVRGKENKGQISTIFSFKFFQSSSFFLFSFLRKERLHLFMNYYGVRKFPKLGAQHLWWLACVRVVQLGKGEVDAFVLLHTTGLVKIGALTS